MSPCTQRARRERQRRESRASQCEPSMSFLSRRSSRDQAVANITNYSPVRGKGKGEHPTHIGKRILSCAPTPYRRAHCAERLAAAARSTTLSPVSELEQQQQRRLRTFFFFSYERKRKENLLCVTKLCNIIPLTAHPQCCTESESLRLVAAAVAAAQRACELARTWLRSLFIASIVHSGTAGCGLYNNNGTLFFVVKICQKEFFIFFTLFLSLNIDCKKTKFESRISLLCYFLVCYSLYRSYVPVQQQQQRWKVTLCHTLV
ncbi:unnamed protein product, partial [Trichogramma brassicae]